MLCSFVAIDSIATQLRLALKRVTGEAFAWYRFRRCDPGIRTEPVVANEVKELRKETAKVAEDSSGKIREFNQIRRVRWRRLRRSARSSMG